MNNFNHEQKKGYLSKLFLILMLFAVSVVTQAQNTSNQQLFTFNLQNRTLEYVIKHIENNSKYVFAYSDLKGALNNKVSVRVNNQTINQVLDLLTPQVNATYEIVKNQILLKKKVSVKQSSVQRPKKTVRGLVTDALTSDPIIGAAVIVKGTTTGTATSMDGDFTLECSEGDTLSVSFIGYSTKDIPVKGVNIYSIALSEDTEQLEEVVVTAFGIGQKKENLVGAIQQLRPSELKVPTSNLSSSFAGRMAGVIAVNRSGEPGADGANFWIRGKSTFSGATGALIIIDGMRASSSDLNALDPEVIESFSILKDATATAMYGTLGANGVMVVTTKKGEDMKKPVINFRVEGSMSSLSEVPQMVDGVRYMELYNEAAARPDYPGVPYSDSKIENTRNGINSLLYPNINWYDEIFKKHSFGQKVNVNIRGGGSKMDYFMSVGVKHNNGNLKSLSTDYYSYNNNINITRYDFVNNLGIKLTKTTKVSLGLNVGIQDYDGPLSSPADLFSDVMNSNPVDFPVRYPAEQNDTYVKWGGKTGGAQGVGYPNPVAELVRGMKSSLSSTVTANLKLDQKLDMITPGLKFSGSFYFKNYSYSGVKRSAGYNKFEIDQINDETGEYTLRMVGTEANTSLVTGADGNTGNRRMYLQAVLNYDRVFNDKHDVSGMLLYNQEQYDTNIPNSLYTSLPQRKQGIAGRLAYGYDGRYLIEANFGYNGSENFAKSHRFGFFPSVGLGYNISQEKYWERFRDVVSSLKLRASWGLVGNDNTPGGRFAYMEDITLTGGPSYSTGVSGSYLSLGGHSWNRYYNPELTWEVGEKLNLGLDMQFFNALNINVELFKEVRKNIFQKRGTIPDILGSGKTSIFGNYGKMQNLGVDLALDYNKQVNKDLFVSFKGTFTYAHNKVLYKDEPEFLLYPNLSDVGYAYGTPLLYVANGLFPDQETIDNNPQQMLGSTPLPGDLWYADIPDANGNYSGTITTDDRIRMGYPADPEIVYGFGPSIKWKNFDFSLFFQGAARTSLVMGNFFPFGNTSIRGVLDFVADNCWTEENQNPNAEFPRLKLGANENNQVSSSYWLRNAAFLKLKNAEIGYTYKKMRFYISGFNLLTFSPFKYWDPEMGGGNGLKYPTQRTFNLGFQMTIN